MLFTLAVALVAAAGPAAATPPQDQQVEVKMTFVESAKNDDCVVQDGGCGHGEVIPLGQATETIEFGAACGGTCDLRTITLEGGTIVAEETFSAPNNLDDVIIGGTGDFEGATGTLIGTVRGTGKRAQIKLSGTISFGS